MTTIGLVMISNYLKGLLLDKSLLLYCLFENQMILTSENHQRKNWIVNLQIALFKTWEKFHDFYQMQFCKWTICVVYLQKYEIQVFFKEVQGSWIFLCRRGCKSFVTGKRCRFNQPLLLKGFLFRATALAKGGGVDGNRGRLKSDGSQILKCRQVLALATYLLLVLVTEGLFQLLEKNIFLTEKEVDFSEMVGVCTVDPVSENRVCIPETGGAAGKKYSIPLSLGMNAEILRY